MPCVYLWVSEGGRSPHPMRAAVTQENTEAQDHQGQEGKLTKRKPIRIRLSNEKSLNMVLA